MAEDNVVDMLNLVNGEAAPRALETLDKFQGSLTEITERTQAFKRDFGVQLDMHKMTISEKLSTAKLKVEDVDRKLNVLFNRLSSEVDTREGEVETAISTHKELAQAFITQSTDIDKHLEDFDANIQSYQSDIETSVGNIAENISTYRSSAEEVHQEVLGAVNEYNAAISDKVNSLVDTLSEGTTSTLDKLDTLNNGVTEKLSQYQGEYNDLFSFLTEQSGAELGAFGEVLDISGSTVETLSEVFDGSIGDIASKLETIGDMIEQIKPILDFIDDLT